MHVYKAIFAGRGVGDVRPVLVGGAGAHLKVGRDGCNVGLPGRRDGLGVVGVTFGLDVRVGAISSSDVVKASEATGFHNATLLNSGDI